MRENEKTIPPSIYELLGVTRICEITDEEILERVITPQVHAILGPVKEIRSAVRETTAGDFPGDEVSNLNNHLLYGGKPGFVRFPYLHTTISTENGCLIIKRDGLKVKITAWWRDNQTGALQLILKVALRDRRYDGSLRANDCALLDFPYDEPDNDPASITIKAEHARAVELSTYGFLPGTLISQTWGDREIESFVASPFTFLEQPERFLELFDRVWSHDRGPGQIGAPIPDLARRVLPSLEDISACYGYDYIENATSHFNVASWLEKEGYRYASQVHEEEVKRLKSGIKTLAGSGVKLTRAQQSWICVLQSLPRELIKEELYLGGAKWPQDNISQTNLWMFKPVSRHGRDCLLRANSFISK